MSDVTAIVVQQMVHGYAEGHREIASSIRLKPRDARTVSVMSDVSSSGLRIPESGYLTAYPLPESNLYVLARTWGAPEIPRPGAVWTHSLLVEFADLPALVDVSHLLHLFKRPSPERFETDTSYRSSLELNVSDARERLPRWNAPNGSPVLEFWALAALDALYGAPSERVLMPMQQDLLPDVEQMILAIWAQQWPRLRRSFRFCTQTVSDRAMFDVQVVPDSERALRTRLSGVMLSPRPVPTLEPTTWQHDALDDLKHPGMLREFLAAIGGAAAGGRASFAALVMLYRLLTQPGPTAEDVDKALHIVTNELEALSPVLTRKIFDAFLWSVDHCSPAAVNFVLDNLGALQIERLASSDLSRLGIAVWRASKDRFKEDLLGSDRHRFIAVAALAALPESEIIAGIVDAQYLLQAVMSQRPELFGSSLLWTSSESLAEEALDLLPTFPLQVQSALAAMAREAGPNLQRMAIARLGAAVVWNEIVELANGAPDANQGVFDKWVRDLAAFPDDAATTLGAASIRWLRCLHSVATAFAPDSIPNAYGHDPWLVARRSASGEIDKDASLFLASFLFARALGPTSRSCAELVELTFEDIHSAAAKDALPPLAWRVLERRLPQPAPWEKWDRCNQLRHAVARLFIDRWLSPSSFAGLGSDSVFRLLVQAAARERGGKAYLRAVRHELDGRAAEVRSEIISKQIDSWF